MCKRYRHRTICLSLILLHLNRTNKHYYLSIEGKTLLNMCVAQDRLGSWGMWDRLVDIEVVKRIGHIGRSIHKSMSDKVLADGDRNQTSILSCQRTVYKPLK